MNKALTIQVRNHRARFAHFADCFYSSVLANTCDALRNLARHEGTRSHPQIPEAIRPLLYILNTVQNRYKHNYICLFYYQYFVCSKVLANTVAAMANLALQAELRKKIVDFGGIRPLVNIGFRFKEEQNPAQAALHSQAIMYIGVALRNLARDENSRPLLVEVNKMCYVQRFVSPVHSFIHRQAVCDH